MIFVVPRDQIEAAWPEIEPLLARIDTHVSTEDVKQELLATRAQAWGWRDGHVSIVWITRIENTYSHRFGVMWMCAGEGLEEVLSVYREHIEPWFWDQGCEWIELNGRKGWRKILTDYDEQSVVLVRRR